LLVTLLQSPGLPLIFNLAVTFFSPGKMTSFTESHWRAVE